MIKKTLIIITAVFIISLCARAQSGIKVGTNTSFISDYYYREYSPEMGRQIGYMYTYNLLPNVSLSAEAELMLYRAHEFAYDEDWGVQKGYVASVPIGGYYHLTDWLKIGGGYMFSYNTNWGALPLNQFDHALFARIIFSVKSFDIILGYSCSLYKGNTGGKVYWDSTGAITVPTERFNCQTFEVSLVYNFGKKKK